MPKLAPICTRILSIGALMVLAAEGTASGFISNGGLSGAADGNLPHRPIDQTYEYGKAVYLGREPGTQKIKYCVKVDGKFKKIRRARLKPFKDGPHLDLANALYNCNNTEQLALLTVKKEQIPFVLYYLNKRFRLDLTNS